MTACGLWPSRRGVVAVLVDGAGRPRPLSIASTDDARWGLAQHLARLDAALVLDESLLEADPVAFMAHRAGVTVWIAGPPLVGSLRCAAGITRGPPRATAALLARLPAIPWLRAHLRRLADPDDPRQVPLL